MTITSMAASNHGVLCDVLTLIVYPKVRRMVIDHLLRIGAFGGGLRVAPARGADCAPGSSLSSGSGDSCQRDKRNVPFLMTLEMSLYRSTRFSRCKSGGRTVSADSAPGAEPLGAKRKTVALMAAPRSPLRSRPHLAMGLPPGMIRFGSRSFCFLGHGCLGLTV